MSLTTTTAANKEPGYFHREYKNDLGEKETQYSWVDQGQRLALVSLPFVSLYKPISTHLAIGMGSLRAVTNLGQLGYIIYQGEEKRKEIPLQLLHTAIAAISLAGTIFGHPIGMIITTVQDLAIEAAQLKRLLEKGDYEKAIGSCISIINNSLYLALLYYGGTPLTIASLATQILGGIYQSQAEFKNGHYLEGSGHLVMAMLRGNQLIGQVKALQLQLGLEKLKQETDVKRSKTPTIEKQGEERVTLSLKNSDTITVVQSDKAITEKAINGSNQELINTLIKCGNNPMGIPAIHYAAAIGDENSVKLLLEHGASPNSKVMFYGEMDFANISTPNTVLEFAARYGHLKVVNLLLDKGAEMQRIVPAYNSQNCIISPHIFAADGNHPHIIRALVSRGVPCNFLVSIGMVHASPLFRGVDANAKDAVQALLELGARVDDPVVMGASDLVALAVQKDSIEMARLLLDYKIPVDHPSFGSSALGKAVETQKIDLMRLLLSRGAKIHGMEASSSHNDPWFLAVKGNNPEIIEILAKAGADIHALDMWGKEATFLAVRDGKLEALKALVKLGCSINVKDKDGMPLIIEALNNSQVLQFLIDAGANTNIMYGPGGNTLLHRAASGSDPQSIHVLMKAGAKINAKNSEDLTPLHLAVRNARAPEQMFLALLERGADVNAISSQGWTPVQLAINEGKIGLTTLKLCIKLGANVNAFNPNDYSFLSYSIMSKKLDVAAFLVNEAGATIDTKSPREGMTPFLRAVQVGYLEGMEFLLGKGANINAQDKYGRTALSLAKERYPQLVDWLIAHGAR